MMERLTSPDSRFFRFMSKVGDLILLNLLWIITSLPIVTIGASTTALYAVMFRVAKNEEGYLARSFLHELKKNFRQSTVIWLVLGAIALVVYMDLWIMAQISGKVSVLTGQMISVLVTLLLFLDFCVFLYAFPLQARYKNTIWQTMKKAFLFSLGYFGHTFQMIGVILLPLGLTMMLGMVTRRGLAWSFLFYLLFGFSVTVYWMVRGPWGRLMNVLEKDEE